MTDWPRVQLVSRQDHRSVEAAVDLEAASGPVQ